MTPRTSKEPPSHEEGFALIWLAVVLIALLLVSGLTLDGGRAYLVQAQLSKAVDGAALAAARMLNSGDPRAEAVSIFRANFPSGYMGTDGSDPTAAGDFFSLTTDAATGVNRVRITASTTMPTTFMSLGNIFNVNVGTSGEATRRMVDLCLVLDTSGSLGWRYPYVRDAARAFVKAFDEENDRFCLVRYSSGASVLAPMNATRGFDKDDIVNAIPNSIPSDGYTSMAEGLWRGWDELRSVPRGQQSSLRIIVLFTDGAANGVPGIWDAYPGAARSLNTSDFPKNSPDPDGTTSNSPTLRGLFDTESGTRSPQASNSYSWTSTSTLSGIPYLPAASAHTHGRSAGIPASFPLVSDTLTVDGVVQSTARALRNKAANGRYPADIWNTNNAARNLVEIIADAARSDTSGDYPIRIYTIGMGELIRYYVGTMPEQPEKMMLRVANDIDSLDFNEGQLEGKYYFAATEADIGVAFQELQNQIIRLSK